MNLLRLRNRDKVIHWPSRSSRSAFWQVCWLWRSFRTGWCSFFFGVEGMQCKLRIERKSVVDERKSYMTREICNVTYGRYIIICSENESKHAIGAAFSVLHFVLS